MTCIHLPYYFPIVVYRSDNPTQLKSVMTELHSLSARALQEKLLSGETTSVDIVNVFLDRIDKYASCLKALISVAPRDILLAQATTLDAERKDGKLRGNLHGIPIIIKVGFPASLQYSCLLMRNAGLHHDGTCSWHADDSWVSPVRRNDGKEKCTSCGPGEKYSQVLLFSNAGC